MLDLTFIRENLQLVQQKAQTKGVLINLDTFETLDKEIRELTIAVQLLQQKRNKAAKTRDIETGKAVKQELEKQENELKNAQAVLHDLLATIPNLPKPDVKIGKDESENEVIRTWGTPINFTFTPKDHLQLGEMLDIIDIKSAAKVSGSRFYYLKKDGALLSFALKQFAFDTLIQEGFIPVIPPVLIRKDIMNDLGYTQMGEEENIFSIAQNDLYLVGTAEQSMVPMHMNDCLKKTDLPRRYVGFSTAFRREAGSYGKDTRGIIRVHQFDKTEMISFVAEGEDDKEQEYFLSLEEKLMQALNIPYQVIKVCTGDLGFNAARKYDLEAWIPTQGKYREMTSASTVTDFQSRRLNMKYQEAQEKKYLNVINGTAFSARPLVAIVENYQQEDGSILVPEVLRKYMGKDKISA
jgi:seryl-tRNA synthetase